LPSNGSSLKDLKCTHSNYGASNESRIVIFRHYPPLLSLLSPALRCPFRLAPLQPMFPSTVEDILSSECVQRYIEGLPSAFNDAGNPKRPMNSFMVFKMVFRGHHSRLPPGIRINDEWNKLSRQQKEPFKGASEWLRQVHETVHPGYVYRPQRHPSFQSSSNDDQFQDGSVRRTKQNKKRRFIPYTTSSSPSSDQCSSYATTPQSCITPSPSPTSYSSSSPESHMGNGEFEEDYSRSGIVPSTLYYRSRRFPSYSESTSIHPIRPFSPYPLPQEEIESLSSPFSPSYDDNYSGSITTPAPYAEPTNPSIDDFISLVLNLSFESPDYLGMDANALAQTQREQDEAYWLFNQFL